MVRTIIEAQLYRSIFRPHSLVPNSAVANLSSPSLTLHRPQAYSMTLLSHSGKVSIRPTLDPRNDLRMGHKSFLP